MNVYTILIFLVSIFLPYLGGKVQITRIKVIDFLVFSWLIFIVYLTMILTSPYLLLSLLLSIILIKFFLKSEMWGAMMKYSIFMAVFIFLFNIILNNQGSTILFEWSFVKITAESVLFSISMILRLEIIMAAFALFNSNVEIEDLITILEKLKFPHRGIITASIALRFFPIMLQEAREIENVFKLRGMPVSTGSLRERVRASYPVMGSLLNISLERAIEIGEALETKGYPSNRRSAWKRIRLRWRDTVALCTFSILAVILTVGFILYGNFQFYPTIKSSAMDNLWMAILLFLSPLSLFLGKVRIYD